MSAKRGAASTILKTLVCPGRGLNPEPAVPKRTLFQLSYRIKPLSPYYNNYMLKYNSLSNSEEIKLKSMYTVYIYILN